MNAEAIVGIVTALVGLPTTLLGILRHFGGVSPRERLIQDIAIRNGLHTNSDLAKDYDQHIKEAARRLLGSDSKRCDPLGIGIAVVFLVLAGATGWFMFENGGWWWLLSPVAGFFLLFGVVGIILDAFPRERDERGRVI